MANKVSTKRRRLCYALSMLEVVEVKAFECTNCGHRTLLGSNATKPERKMPKYCPKCRTTAQPIRSSPILDREQADPGRNEVRIKPESGSVSNFASGAEDVDTALRLRHEKIRTLAIREETRAKLLSLKRASEARFQRTAGSVDEHIFKKWNGLLKRLSR